MSRDEIADIIELCRAMVLSAQQAYAEISAGLVARTGDHEMAAFWRELSGQEADQSRFWSALHELALEGGIPSLFEDPRAIRVDLEAAYEGVARMSAQAPGCSDLAHAIFITFSLEFFALNPLLSHLYSIVRTIGLPGLPELEYDEHVDFILGKLRPLVAESSATGLLGKALGEMWTRTRSLSEEMFLDRLTGLPSRRGFDWIAPTLAFFAGKRGHKVGVLVCDLADLRDIDRTVGRALADTILMDAAATLKTAIRPSDLLARYADAELITVMTSVEPQALEQVRTTVLDLISGRHWGGTRIGAHVGSALGTLDENEAEEGLLELVRQAGRDLLSSKAVVHGT